MESDVEIDDTKKLWVIYVENLDKNKLLLAMNKIAMEFQNFSFLCDSWMNQLNAASMIDSDVEVGNTKKLHASMLETEIGVKET
jgi:hypothetical protein